MNGNSEISARLLTRSLKTTCLTEIGFSKSPQREPVIIQRCNADLTSTLQQTLNFLMQATHLHTSLAFPAYQVQST